jgi:putative tryptophan/tyrosine transport system substrate-binding protein
VHRPCLARPITCPGPGGGPRPAAAPHPCGRAVGWFGPVLLAGLALLLAMGTARAGGFALIKGRDFDSYNRAVTGFRQAAPRGWIEYDLQGDDSNAEFTVQALRRQAPTLVVVVGPRAALLARTALPRVPLLCLLVDHPERVAPGGRGVAWLPSQPGGAEVAKLVKALVPRARVLGAVFGGPSDEDCEMSFESGAYELGVELRAERAASAAAVADAFRRAAQGSDAVWFGADPVTASPASFEMVRRLCAERRLPLVVFSAALVRAGALASVGLDFEAVGRQAGRLALRASEGSTLEGEQALDAGAVATSVNLKVAGEQGLTVPKALQAQSAGR